MYISMFFDVYVLSTFFMYILCTFYATEILIQAGPFEAAQG